jgi:hypothetical protein
VSCQGQGGEQDLQDWSLFLFCFLPLVFLVNLDDSVLSFHVLQPESLSVVLFDLIWFTVSVV